MYQDISDFEILFSYSGRMNNANLQIKNHTTKSSMRKFKTLTF